MITGDRSFGPGHSRFELQKEAVEALEVLFVGRGSMWPRLPAGAFDVVTTQDPFWRGLFGWYAARRTKAKLNVQVHTDLAVQPFIKHVLGQIVLRHADSVRVVSEKIKQQVVAHAAHAKVFMLPVFVELDTFKKVVREAHDTPTVLWLGRFEKEKDPLYALEVFAQVQKHVDAKLIMLGRGSLESALKREAQGLPVEFPGWQEPVPYMELADVVLSTSQHESWGASIIEALAAGVPVVAPDVGVAREAGAIVAPRNELVQEVIKVLQSKAHGTLALTLPSRDEWKAAWRKSLQ